MIKIKNKQLEVEIAEIGELYNGSRFDQTSFITQVTLDGKHTFCGAESPIEGMGSGGRGLCGEFGIIETIGYDDAKPGEMFPKIGVGLLKRPDYTPYSFSTNYEVDPFDIECIPSNESVSFVIQPKECRGYAMRLSKTLTISDNRLEINYVLTNSGSKALHTDEYCHNFLSINSQTINADYLLTTSLPPPLKNTPEILHPDGNKISWSGKPKTTFYFLDDQVPTGTPAQWTLSHTPSGVGVRETSNFPLSKFALWGTQHVVSPETFFRIDLQPGEETTWRRVYEFLNITASD